MKNNKFVIVLDGPMGSGKTTVANLLAKKLKRTALLSYDIQKRSITDFQDGDSDMIADARKALMLAYMKYGLNILLDGGFFRGTRLKPFINLARKNGYGVFIYHLEADPEILLNRALTRKKNHAKASNSKKKIIWNQSFHEENRYRGEEVVSLDSSKMSPVRIVKKIMQDIQLT